MPAKKKKKQSKAKSVKRASASPSSRKKTGKRASPSPAKRGASSSRAAPKKAAQTARQSQKSKRKPRVTKVALPAKTKRASKRRVCNDGKGLVIEVSSIEPARIRMLRGELNLRDYFIYLDTFALEDGDPPVSIDGPNTSMMSEFWNDEGDGTFAAGIGDQVLVGPELMSIQERKRLLDGVGQVCVAQLSFRKGGDDPPLVEGRDFELIGPHRFELCSVELCDADW